LTQALRGHKEERASSLFRHEGGLRAGESSAVNRETDILNIDSYRHRTN